MKLTEFLKTVAEDEYVYLGALSCYLWIGHPTEILEKLPSLDDDYTERNRDSIERNAWVIKDLKNQMSKNDKLISKGKDVDGLKRVNKRLAKELARQEKRKTELAEWLENRVPFGEREVRDSYRRRIVEPVGTVVIIDGDEIGDYWMLDEIENGEGVREPTE